MWLVTRDGFYSVVEERNTDGAFVLVWTRTKQHAETLCQVVAYDAKVVDMPKADYRYRVSLPREVWRDYLYIAAADITYDSHFKEAVRAAQPKKIRAQMYTAMMRTWNAFADLQPTEPYTGRKRK